jgi:hypothetical protein
MIKHFSGLFMDFLRRKKGESYFEILGENSVPPSLRGFELLPKLTTETRRLK